MSRGIAKQHNTADSTSRNSSSNYTVLLSIGWAAAVGLLLLLLMNYSQTSGAVAPPPAAQECGIELDTSRHTLFVAIHPKCPCSAASMYELERLIARSDDKLSVHMLMYRPSSQSESWHNSVTITSLTDLDTVTWEWDNDGVIARSLGCLTSGSVVLYEPNGRPLYWGGITSARGHAGDNPGSDSILRILRQGSTTVPTSPVYGCEISTNGSSCVTHEDKG